uniref:tRNA acetyltransferase TAN1 n=1 Tax=Tetraselmis sp. GSL018 TaxID=582737 RepID=A0A061QXB3_9CHLO|mmetsp:Transcript_9370/g.22567  ORF Transcript_9370/g.22567 Transcript_9370/m.22567 type:complete len:277 (-) Transcript_9370:282-1112(-)
MSDNKRKSGSEEHRSAPKEKKQRYGKAPANSKSGLPKEGKGVLVTCDANWERVAGQEAVDLLSDCWEKLNPQTASADRTAPASVALQAELKEAEGQASRDSRFFWTKLDIQGLIFVKMKTEEGKPGPSKLVEHILREISETKQMKSRHCIRLIPVEESCQASLEQIKELSKTMADSVFKGSEGLKFAVAFEKRGHSGECNDRMKVIDTVVGNIEQPPNKVDLTKPDKTVLVQIVKNSCGMSIVDNYHKLKKYNMRSASAPEEEGAADKAKEAAGGE